MPESRSKIIELRALLAEKFPAGLRPEAARWETGIGVLDGLLHGGLRRGTLTEIARREPAMGAAFLLQSLLARTWAHEQRMALVDGRDRLRIASCTRLRLAHDPQPSKRAVASRPRKSSLQGPQPRRWAATPG